MIDEDIFGDQVKRLRARFGEKAFDNEFCRILANEVRDITPMAFVMVTTWLIGSRAPNRPPLLADFQDAIRRTMAHARRKAEELEPEVIKCYFCNDSGVCEVEDRKTGKEYFMRCKCEGDKPERRRDWRKTFRSELPFYSDENHKSDFKLLTMFGVRALRWKPKTLPEGRFEMGAMREKVEEWQLKTRISEIFWRDRGEA